MTISLLVIRAGALGDTILCLPAIHELRRRYPGGRITAVGRPEYWEVAGDLVDEIVSVDAPLLATLHGSTPSAELAAWLRQFDLALAWTRTDVTPALRAAGIPVVVHRDPFPPPGVHAAAWLAESVRETRIPQPSALCDRGLRDAEDFGGSLVMMSADEMAAARKTLRSLGLDRPLFVHPGAGAEWKRWPAPRFAELIRRVLVRHNDVALIAGPADDDAVAAVFDGLSASIPVVRESSARRLAAILAQGRAFLGNDSGVTHLAAAVGTPTIALFGPTDPASWRPLGPARVVRCCAVAQLDRHDLRACYAPDCLALITVDKVLSALAAVARH